MCGGCWKEHQGDWLTPAVSSRMSRERAATTVNHLAQSTRLRVRAAATGFTVHHPTGRAVVAPTLSAVWAEVIRAGVPDLVLPMSDVDKGAAESGPVVPSGRLSLLLADSPDRVASAWAADRVVALSQVTSLHDVLSTGRFERVLVWTRSNRAAAALTAVTDPGLRLRVTTAAVLRDGDGPEWASDVRQIDEQALHTTLAGEPATTEARPELGLPEAAAWVAGLLACGHVVDRRITLRVARGTALIDAAHGLGLAVRPAA